MIDAGEVAQVIAPRDGTGAQAKRRLSEARRGRHAHRACAKRSPSFPLAERAPGMMLSKVAPVLMRWNIRAMEFVPWKVIPSEGRSCLWVVPAVS